MIVQARLDRLEKQNRWLRRSLVVALTVAGVAWLTGQSPPGQAQPRQDRTVEAERFVLLDATGKKRAVLGAEKLPNQEVPGSPGLYLFDDEGNVRIVLNTTKEGGAGIAVCDRTPNLNPQVVLMMSKEGNAGLGLQDGNGKSRALMEMEKDKAPVLILQDENGKKKLAMAMTADSRAFLTLNDQNEKTRAVLGMDPDGSPHFALQDANANPLFVKP
jgi:hypothetical protein